MQARRRQQRYTCIRRLVPAFIYKEEMKINVEIKELNVDLRGLVQLLLVLLYVH